MHAPIRAFLFTIVAGHLPSRCTLVSSSSSQSGHRVRYIFYQYVNEPTRDSQILDLVLSTSSCFVSTTCTACPISTSDHNTVVFEVNAQDIATDKNLVPESVYYRDFEHANYQNLNEYLCAIDWNNMFQFCFTTEQCWGAFMYAVNTAVEKFIPMKCCCLSSLKKTGVHYEQIFHNI